MWKLWQSALIGSLYYGYYIYYNYYKWIIQEELRNYNSKSWSGALCLLPVCTGYIIIATVSNL
ncbi:hypothetical protein LBWT_17080 [Leptolyngbya boryana IAM M-101]|uniref:hypothetical protein n=1 Tax=Leptolyngbya TaxID=47251 RepID=UPI001181A289|nr:MULTISPECIES: hypothetical protein [Leptolyngbya]MBD2367476.1 hypothetical protein [Leptolyngbya sp. FACHB-161]MBD2374000.1 hypothetical protein [Leptolyngbya sp. FACHB-238]MBD2398200.1 hypothetical protein [Leptolyngbya sp. FACHB-239]MBD2404303.1 hypothetical protein [Leptolyngbya sp. FACHB-402]BAS55802.1 hypothetical protein LBWT_17080 [Leptolyngbya boryana IAM M-101]